MTSFHVPQNGSAGSTAAANLLPLPVTEQVRDLATALSLNKPQLARILKVTRATVDSWRRGGEPSATTVTRLRRLVSLLSLSSVSGTAPLNARFARHPSKPGQASLVELLSDRTWRPTPSLKNSGRPAPWVKPQPNGSRIARSASGAVGSRDQMSPPAANGSH